MALISMPSSALGILNLKTGSIVEGSSADMPGRSVQSDQNGVTVTYEISFAELADDPLYPASKRIRIPGFGSISEAGKPEVPIRSDIISVPANKTAKITVTNTSFREIPIKLAPARPVLWENNYDGYTLDNVPPVSHYSGYFPNVVANKEADYVYRGNNLLAVNVCPVLYSVSNGIARICTTLQYRIDFVNSNNPDLVSGINYNHVSITDHTLANNTLNAQDVTLGEDPVEDTKGMVIVTTNPFMEAARTFAEWKKATGYDTGVLCRDKWTPEDIENAIKEYYQLHPALYAVVLLGDQANVPAKGSNIYWPHKTDFYYGCVTDGKHLIPDLLRGRISVSNPAEAKSVIRKIIYYESIPQNDTGFYKTGLHCAHFQDGDKDLKIKDGYADTRYAQTSEEILNFMSGLGFDIERVYSAYENVTPLFWNNTRFSFGESIPDYLKKPGFKWNGNSADITNAINKGVSYVLFRGHGGENQWENPNYMLSNIKSLSNGGNLPVVFSITCYTGTLGSTESFAEAFLRHSNGGCAGIIAATDESYSGYNDEFAIEMFNAMYPDSPMVPEFPDLFGSLVDPPGPIHVSANKRKPLYKLGEIMDHGLAKAGTRYMEFNELKLDCIRERFHCFGDPTMPIHLQLPKTFTGIRISRSNPMNVTLPEGKIARISFYDKMKNKVLSYIGNYATYMTETPEDVIVSVTDDEYLPYLDYGKGHVEYIQNETVTGMMSCTAEVIKVGNNVTQERTSGDVVFKNGTMVLKAKNIELNPGTSIEAGTNFVITTN